MPINNAVDAALVKIASNFVEKMREKLSSGYPGGDPNRGTTSIQDATSIGAVYGDDVMRRINVMIDLKRAPYAAAYEWGSGLRGKFNEKYPIIPKNSDRMYFPKEDWPNYQPPPPAPDVFAFLYVEHPGVAPRPYIQPSLAEVLPEAKAELAKQFKAELVATIKLHAQW